MIIYIKTLSGDSTPLEVNESDSIEAIKQQIEKRLNAPVSSQKLYFNSTLLFDDKTAEEYKIGNEETIHLVLSLSDEINVIISEGNDDPRVFNISIKATVLTLRTIIQTEMNYDNFYLTHSFTILKDQMTLEESGIINNSTIFLNVRLTGGMLL